MNFDLTKREAFTLACLRQLGAVVCWGKLDCSELVAVGEHAIGLEDRRSSYRARTYATRNRDTVVVPKLGDLGFFGPSFEAASHVVACSFGGQILSADGATAAVQDLAEAMRNPRARVRLHNDISFYKSAPFLGWRNHFELDLP